MTDKALEAALPGEAEVVAWAYPQGEKLGVTTNRQTACDAFPGIAKPIPLVTLASLQAMQARAEKAEALVEQAFRDGLAYGSNTENADPDLAWGHSRARQALEAHHEQ